MCRDTLILNGGDSVHQRPGRRPVSAREARRVNTIDSGRVSLYSPNLRRNRLVAVFVLRSTFRRTTRLP
jgi:hypothetical protein